MILLWLINAHTLVRQTVALSLATCMASAVVWVGTAAVDNLHTVKAAVDEKRATLGQLNAVIDLAAQMDGGTPSTSTDNREFLAGDSEAIVRAGLQTRLNTTATAAGVEVISAGNAPSLNEGGLAYIGLRASLSGSLKGVHTVLFDLETSFPVLFIREALLHTTNPVEGAPSEPEIVAEITFFGALQSKVAATGVKR